MNYDTSIRSPNHSPRGGRPILGLVMHATAGTARSALAWLTNPAARVSAHVLIDKGGRVYQLVPDELAAWHAGRSAWRGETQINEVTLGCELENQNTGRDPYPPAQMAAAIAWAREKVSRYGCDPAWVVRHSDIAIPRGRKSDPAGFDWDGFRAAVFGPALPVIAGDLYRTRAKVWARPKPGIASGPYTTVPAAQPVGVMEIVEGEFVRNSWGASNLWARTAAGFIWLPQLEAL